MNDKRILKQLLKSAVREKATRYEGPGRYATPNRYTDEPRLPHELNSQSGAISWRALGFRSTDEMNYLP